MPAGAHEYVLLTLNVAQCDFSLSSARYLSLTQCFSVISVNVEVSRGTENYILRATFLGLHFCCRQYACNRPSNVPIFVK